MDRTFHDNPFDPATKIKLEIFRHCVRKWLPVFLPKAPHTVVFKSQQP